jgi:cytochrome P450
MVRVTPEELSIVDPNFQDTRYGGIGVKRNKNERFARQSVSPTSILNTLDHDLHRVRRAPLNGFFSKQAISRFEPTVQSKVERVVEKLKRACVQGAVLRAQDVYGALTTDVISHYAYGESFGFLDDGKEGFKNDYLRDTEAFFKMTHFAKHFHVAASVMLAIPEWVVVRLHKGMASMAEIVNFSKRCALDTLVSLDLDNKVKALDAKPMSIFQALCKSDVPAEERSLQRLTDEGIVVILAGLETTARFLTNITYHLLSNPAMLQELRAELKKVMPTPDARVTCAVLENLPYMVSSWYIPTCIC